MRAAVRMIHRLLSLRFLLPAAGLLAMQPFCAQHAVAQSVLAQLNWTNTRVFVHRPNADLSGIYSGQAPASDAARRVFTLNLAADGTATLSTLYIGKENAVEHGQWKQMGDQVELTFDAMGPNQPPRPIIFRHRDHQLSPLHWDASEWGRSGPPVLHWSRAPGSPARGAF